MSGHFKATKKNVAIFALALIFFVSILYVFSFIEFFHNFSKAIHSITIIAEYVKVAGELALLFLALINRKTIMKWFLKRREFKGTGDEFIFPKEKVTAMVIPVSRMEQPEWIIRHLEPERVAFLYTEQSKNYAVKLIKLFSDKVHFIHTPMEIEAEKDMIRDPNDPREAKELTAKFLEYFKINGIKEENIFLDTTGGKVPMSIGAFQAAEEMGVSSIYIVGKANGIIKDPQIREQGYPIFLSKKE